MDRIIMTKAGKADRIASTPVERVQLVHEGYVEKATAPVADEPSTPAPALTQPAPRPFQIPGAVTPTTPTE